MINDIQDYQPLRGDIEDVILNGSDVDGKVPKLNVARAANQIHFRYDLINLDFMGGVGYRDKNGVSKRVRALKKLFERQQGTSFVLLLTLNVRDRLDDELTSYLTGTSGRVGSRLQQIVDWYATSRPGKKEYKLKAIIPLFIQSIAEGNMLRSHAYPPIAYGSGSRMVHFAFSLTHTAGNFQAFSKQTTTDLLNLPLVRMQNGALAIADEQHPGYNFEYCSTTLRFLPKETYELILATIPASKGDHEQ